MTTPSGEEHLAEVVGTLSAVQDCGADSLDLVEMVEGLREEFGGGIVHRAIRLLEARRKADPPPDVVRRPRPALGP